MPEGRSGVLCLAAFFICAGSGFVNLFNQVARLSVLGDFESQPRVKVGFLYNLAQYFCRKIDFAPVHDFGQQSAYPRFSRECHLFSLFLHTHAAPSFFTRAIIATPIYAHIPAQIQPSSMFCHQATPGQRCAISCCMGKPHKKMPYE